MRFILGAVLVALVMAPAASAQTVQAVDGTAADNYNNRWTPQTTSIRVGQTVTWSFAGTSALHNVASSGANWSFRNGNPGSGSPSASHTFTAPGTYRFICEVHATTMFGDVLVSDASGNPPPPPPPPPLSEQPFPNDAGAPGAFEVDDGLAPRLSRLAARPWHRGARLRFRLDEPAVVSVRVTRARVTVKRTRAMLLRGTRRLTIRHLRAGHYRLLVTARDLAGNRSRTRHARVTVR
ncbi:MAG TPA: plastocyanin/azurin family copper-binding protein [Solirubrobacteraceae bacterium]|nr:plastocyanin/azurin family copper-binding protein [Solirubrobacteraceae bacterium]